MSPADADRHATSRYRVLELLGRGGMGAVYRAVDLRDGRQIALKRQLAEPGSERAATERFEREFLMLSELAHPRIIEVYDYGVDAEGAFYTMQLLGGQDLHEMGRVDWRKACALLRDVASSLAILHSRRLVHCDVSARNVRCASDGRPKLLDFGAVVPMGPTRRVTGTPPSTAPEMAQLQPIDGRADIFGLGAIGYRLLTGVHAYPAQTFSQLRSLWQQRLRSPSEIEPSVPGALSQLIMECLQLDADARPRSASVVMERLCAIAGLPLDEHDEVATAYLTTPTLIGRDALLSGIRLGFSAALRGVGNTFIVRGEEGSGRSRVLDACVLEAKRLGYSVLRADAGDGGRGRYSAIRSICHQLFELHPDAAQAAAEPHADALAVALSPERPAAPRAPEAASPLQVLLAVEGLILSAARGLRLLIAVDDLDRVDQASLSCLVSLAQATHSHSLCLIGALDAHGKLTDLLDRLGGEAQLFDLPLLTEEQTEELIKSVFGDVSHVLTAARRIHAVARGNPRAILQLAEHLLQRGVVQYQAGTFLLPERLRERDLPDSLGDALSRRIGSLGADALELAQALSLTDPSELEAASYPLLTAHRDRARTFRAIDELVRAQLLSQEGDRYRLSEGALRRALLAKLTPAKKRELHARLSRSFAQRGSVARRAVHLMESDQAEAAIRVLLASYIDDPSEPGNPLSDYVPGLLFVLERAVAAAERMQLSATLRAELSMKTAAACQHAGDLAGFLRVAPRLLSWFKRDGGIDELTEISAAAGNRIEEDADVLRQAVQTAMARAQARYDATPAHERGLPPPEARERLSRLCAMYAGVFGIGLDIDQLDTLPSLAPLSSLSPNFEITQRFVEASRLLVEGRSKRARRVMLRLLSRLEQGEGESLGSIYEAEMRSGLRYMLGLVEARWGLPSARLRVAELESQPGHRVNAYRVDMICQLMQGNLAGAAEAQRNAELSLLHDGRKERYPGATARAELMLYAILDDLPGLRQVSDRIGRSTRTHLNRRVLSQLGRCHHRRVQGDFAGALAALEPALATVAPARHIDWPFVAAAHVQVLCGLGRADEAVRLGRDYLATCEREAILPSYGLVALATAEALLAIPRAHEAAALADLISAEAAALGARGALLGRLYELRAAAALAASDREAFDRFRRLCAAEYQPEQNPTLGGRYRRLLRAAERAGFYKERAVAQGQDAPALDGEALGIARRLTDGNREARIHGVLQVLSEYLEPEAAHLYTVREGRARLLGSRPPQPAPEGLREALEAYLHAERKRKGERTLGTSEAATEDAEAFPAVRCGCERFYPLVLATASDPTTAVAVALVKVAGVPLPAPSQSVCEALAAALSDAPASAPVPGGG